MLSPAERAKADKWLADHGKNALGASSEEILSIRDDALALRYFKYLISKGADVNAWSDDDRTPLVDAVSAGNLEIVKFLVSKGADVNKRGRRGMGMCSPLWVAINYKETKIADYLKSVGAEDGGVR
jgi:ankyrin repeat protein